MTSKPTRRSVLLASVAAAACSFVPRVVAGVAGAAEGGLPVGGVNLAGADFGKIPGVHGTEYLYPPLRHFEYFRNLGFALVRLPFKWERLQPSLNAPFSAQEQGLLVATVRHATSHGQELILDPHNYAKRRIPEDGWAKEHAIGSTAVPIAAFTDFWSRLAALFKGDERVIFGLMNEPVGLPVESWLQAANAAVAAIRATGAANLILVPGIAYSGAHSWLRVDNTAMAGIVDPIDRFAFDVHQYFDRDSSGTRPDAVSGTIGSERIEGFQDWARQHGFKAVLGEFNGGRNPASYNALHDICQEMAANSDVWIGWAAWAAGPRWPDGEMFTLEPWRDGRMREQTAILARYARPQSPDFWVTDGAAVDFDFARNRFRGAPSPEATLRGRLGAAGFAFSGPLLALVQEPAFTLVITTRGLPLNAGACDILTANGGLLLRRAENGAAEAAAAFGEPLRTAAQPLRNWQAKRRVAISVDRHAGRIGVGATGVTAAEALATVPEFGEVTLGGAGLPEPAVAARITAYRGFRSADALNVLLA